MKNLILLAGLWGWFSFRVNIASLMVIAPTITAAVLCQNLALSDFSIDYILKKPWRIARFNGSSDCLFA